MATILKTTGQSDASLLSIQKKSTGDDIIGELKKRILCQTVSG
jgi:hypothetical protein